jgi:phosphate:Na+ symporter
MNIPHIIVSVFALITLFLFSIQKFSSHIQRIAGEKFKTLLHNSTKTPFRGFLAGTVVTALIQSSTATSVILVSLVDAGLITFHASLGAIIGSNIGTTITAWLIALKLTYIAPFIVIVGFIISQTHTRFQKYGKTLFYFGIMFFALFSISFFLEPLKDSPTFKVLLSDGNGLFISILIGAVTTLILQSSAVFTGLVITLASSGLIGLVGAVGLILGSNVGTTATAFIASITANTEAKKVALAHILFNVIGVLIFLPFINPFISLIKLISPEITIQVVNAHFLFNIISVILGLIFIKPFGALIERLVKTK